VNIIARLLGTLLTGILFCSMLAHIGFFLTIIVAIVIWTDDTKDKPTA
jgi:hypothetical protein